MRKSTMQLVPGYYLSADGDGLVLHLRSSEDGLQRDCYGRSGDCLLRGGSVDASTSVRYALDRRFGSLADALENYRYAHTVPKGGTSS